MRRVVAAEIGADTSTKCFISKVVPVQVERSIGHEFRGWRAQGVLVPGQFATPAAHNTTIAGALCCGIPMPGRECQDTPQEQTDIIFVGHANRAMQFYGFASD